MQQNTNIVDLYKSLCAQQDALSVKIQNETDPKLADAYSTENYEIMHRIVLTQSLLFQSDSAALQKSVQAVKTADGQLQSGLAKIKTAVDVVNAVSGYLSYVDQAIDLAKTLAPLAA